MVLNIVLKILEIITTYHNMEKNSTKHQILIQNNTKQYIPS